MAKDDGKPPSDAAVGTGQSRKRRRKTTTAGAAEDCFACQKRQVTCDRRRPYCGPCLSLGHACSGYRTVLTWGVGVASRGKLRGMTLPVTNTENRTTNKTTATPPPSSAAKRKKEAPQAVSSQQPETPKAQSASKKRRRSLSPVKSEGSDFSREASRPPPTTLNQQQYYPQQHSFQPINVQRPRYEHGTRSNVSEVWQNTEYRWPLNSSSQDLQFYPSPTENSSSSYVRHSPRDSPLDANTSGRCDASIAAQSDSTLDNSDFPPTPERVAFADPFTPQQHRQRQQQLQHQLLPQQQNHHHHPPSSYPQQQQQQQQANPSYHQQLQHHSQQVQPELRSYTQPYARQYDHVYQAPVASVSHSMPVANLTSYHDQNSHQTASYGQNTGYYSPEASNVQMDAALSMTKLREVNDSDYTEHTVNNFGNSFDKLEDPDIFDDIEEENYVTSNTLVPRIAPSYFNSAYPYIPPRMQYLLDYYNRFICNVLVTVDGDDNPYRKHVLSLAMHNEGLQNALGALVTNNMRMRTLIDVSTIKEEADLSNRKDGPKKNSIIPAPTPEEQWYKAKSIEHLNLQLSSQSNARDESVLATLLILCLFHVSDSGFSKFKTQLAGVQKLLKMRGKDFRSEFVGWVEMFFAWFDVMSSSVNDREVEIQGESLDFLDLSANFGALEQFSGCEGRLFKLIARLGRLNLLSQNRPVRDLSRENARRSSNDRAGTDRSSNHGSTPDYYSLSNESLQSEEWQPLNLRPNIEKGDFPDERHAFWREWRDIRRRLEEWSLDQPYEDNGPKTPAGPEKELLHISESFRYAALIYTERLAFPDLPSASPNFQRLVDRAIYHITEIAGDSCVIKFMLWPLFITGTECVNEAHRELIRTRCIQILQESGFYNNLSGLQVLERVWKESGAFSSPSADPATAAGAVASGSGSAPHRSGKSATGRQQAFHWRNAMDRVDGEYIVI